MDQKRPVFVGPGWQRSRHQARERAECASLAAGGQAQRAGHESGLKLQVWIERPPGDVRARNNRLAQKTHGKRRQRAKPQPRSFGGRKRRLVQVAAATAASPTGRSAGAHPEIMSQKARNSAARVAAIGPKAGEASPVGALNGQIQHAPATQCPIAPTPGREHRARNLARLIAGAARHPRSQSVCYDAARELSCSPRQGKHRGRDHRRRAPSAAGCPAWADSCVDNAKKKNRKTSSLSDSGFGRAILAR